LLGSRYLAIMTIKGWIMRAFFAVIAIAFVLGSCAAYEQQQREQSMAQAAAQAASDDAQCQSYGAAPASPVYVQCRMNLDNQRAQAAENNRSLAVQYLLSHR
jgi:hypothetical protein